MLKTPNLVGVLNGPYGRAVIDALPPLCSYWLEVEWTTAIVPPEPQLPLYNKLNNKWFLLSVRNLMLCLHLVQPCSPSVADLILLIGPGSSEAMSLFLGIIHGRCLYSAEPLAHQNRSHMHVEASSLHPVGSSLLLSACKLHYIICCANMQYTTKDSVNQV